MSARYEIRRLTLDNGEDELRFSEPANTEYVDRADKDTDDSRVYRCMTIIGIPECEQDLCCGDFDGYRDCVRVEVVLGKFR